MVTDMVAMTAAEIPRVGCLLKRYRRQAGLTQEALAEQAGLSVRGIQDLERGVSRTPRRETVVHLATALGVPAPDLEELVNAANRHAIPARSIHAVGSSATPLVGRGRELALLEQFLTREGDGPDAAPMFLLAGEPGIGKTRLLDAVASEATAKGWRVLKGACLRRERHEPYAPLLDALAQHVEVVTGDRLAHDLAECSWLVRLLPELVGILDPPETGAIAVEQERRLTYASVARFLTNAAGPTGTLLILDDLQWSGPDGVDLLMTLLHLARSGSPPGLPLRVVGAYRDTEVGLGGPFDLLLADLAQGGLVRSHFLRPLEPQDSRTLLARLLIDAEQGQSSAIVEHVLERAEGIPFFLVSYAQALRMGNEEAVPWNLAQAVRVRVAGVPAARDVLGVAAIVGRWVPRALLAAVIGQSEEAVLDGLEAACGARLLLEQGEDAYEFAHDLIREVVEADLGAARRAKLHGRVAEALERDPARASPELLAYHYSLSDSQHRAVPYRELAADRAADQHARAIVESHRGASPDSSQRWSSRQANSSPGRVNA